MGLGSSFANPDPLEALENECSKSDGKTKQEEGFNKLKLKTRRDEIMAFAAFAFPLRSGQFT